MDTEIQQLTELDAIDQALDNLPQEAKDFLYGEGFANALSAVTTKFTLSPEQQSELDLHLTQVIALIEPRDELLTFCDVWKFTPEQKKQFVDMLEDLVFTPLVEATNYIVEDEDTNEESTDVKQASSNTVDLQKNVLATLGERLSQATIVTPTVRDQSMSRSVPATEVPTVDPYREMPDA